MQHLPREHGATVMVLSGMLAGFASEPHLRPEALLMGVAILAGYFARDPLGLLLRRPSPNKAARRNARASLLLFGPLGAGAGLLLLLRLPSRPLLAIAAVGALLFGALVAARARNWERSVFAEGLGVLSLALPPLAMVLATRGQLEASGLRLSAACLLFFVGSTLHLRALVRSRRAAKAKAPATPAAGKLGASSPTAPSLASAGATRHSAWQATLSTPGSVLVFVGLAYSGVFPWGYAAAGAVALARPLLIRGWVLKDPRRVGFTETALTLVFIALLTTTRGVP